MALISFAPWHPDTAELNSQYTADVRNVLAAAGSYIPAPGLVELTGALPARCLGGFIARASDGGVFIFAGTSGGLYLLNNGTLEWDEVSKAATTYNATTTAQWSFTQFGNFVIAVNQNDDPQAFEIGSSTEFADLGGDPPRAGVVRVWGDFVVLMQLTSNPSRVHWSGLNNAEWWTPGEQNCDYQEFPDGGVVQGSNEQTNPVIFQERAIRKGTFVPGSLEIFTFQKIHDVRGAKSSRSIASRGSYAFYADEGGFFQISPEGALESIGFEKVDRTIFGKMNASDIAQIHGAVDPFFSRVYWLCDTNGTGTYDTMLVFDWNLQMWTQIAVNVQFVFPIATTGYTLESLDDISSSLEDLPFSLDSKVWQGGAPILGAFTLDNIMGSFSGLAMEATLTTAETGDTAGQMQRVTSAYPVIDTDEARVSYGIRHRRSDLTTWLPEARQTGTTGRVQRNARTRFLKVKVRIPEGTDWSHAQGVDVALSPAGLR